MNHRRAIFIIAVFFAAIIILAPFLQQQGRVGQATTGLKCELTIKNQVSMVTLRKGTKLCVPFVGNEYMLELVSLNREVAELQLRPYNEPFHFPEESTQTIDLNGDGIDDATVSLLGIEKAEAATFQISLRSAVETPITPEAGPEQLPTPQEPAVTNAEPEMPEPTEMETTEPIFSLPEMASEQLSTFLLFGGGVVLLVMLLIVFFLSLKHSHKDHPHTPLYSHSRKKEQQEVEKKMVYPIKQSTTVEKPQRAGGHGAVPPHTQAQLKEYIVSMRQKGYSDEQILDQLKKAGWEESYVKAFF